MNKILRSLFDIKKAPNSITVFSLLIVCIALNIMSCFIDNQSFVNSMFLALTNWTTLVSYLMLYRKPMISILLICVSHISLIINDLYLRYSFTEALSNTGLFEIFSWIFVVIFSIWFYKDLSKDKNFKGKKLKEKVISVINYDRAVIKVPVWATFVIWCMILTMIFTAANDMELTGQYEDSPYFRVYSAIVMIIPSVLTFARFTTSNLAYQLMAFSCVMKLVTMYNLFIRQSLNVNTAIYTIIETMIIVYAIILYRKSIKDNKDTKEK